jgi:geranylgeranyl diphosphate synthase type I
MTAGATALPSMTHGRLPLTEDDQQRWTDRIATHVDKVEQRLSAELDDLARGWRSVASEPHGPLTVDPPTLLRELLRRGGKRTRPVMTLLGWVAGDRHGRGCGYDDVVLAASAIELLHCFALVHDDVMDETDVRRGRPTVHSDAAWRHAQQRGHGSSARFGDSIAVLVGDLAHSEADRLAAALPPRMSRIWRQMVLELLAGQLGDVTGAAAADRRVGFARSVARQKTGYYTVARPLQLGAAAAGADEAVLLALGEYGRHAGEAFALRDDLLGVFGDPDTTGKPISDDLRAGKPTVLLALASESLRGAAARALQATGTPSFSPAQAQLVRDAMIERGVVATVESMIDERVSDAVAALPENAVTADAIAQLSRVVNDLARRER